MARSNNLYGDFGSVPDRVEVSGSGARPFSVRADAADFGADIGQGLQNVSRASEQTASWISDKIQKEQDIINRTLTTQAEIKYASDLADISINYKSLPGLQSYEKLPEYKSQVSALRQKYAETLPEPARQEFDFIALNYEKSAIVDAHSFAAKAVKEADLQSGAEAIAMLVTQAGYKPVAEDDYRFGKTLGDIQVNVAKQFEDAPGVTLSKETGYYEFLDTVEAKQTQESFGRALDEAMGKAWVSRFQTLADDDPISAFEKYKIDKEEIPSQFQIALDAFFYPRVRNAYANNVANSAIKEADAGYAEVYAKTGKPDPVAVVMKNELHADGVIRVHADGDGQAIGGINSDAFPEQFAEASDILRNQGQAAARKYIENFYQKEIIEKNGIQNLPANVQEIVVDGVTNHRSEIQRQLVDAAKNGASPQELIDIRRAEYDRLVTENPAKYGQYKDAWNRRLDDFGINKTTFESGAIRPPTIADFYRENYDKILNNAKALAEKERPGDTQYIDMARSKAERYMNDVIKQQELTYKLDNNKLYQATTGALTGGRRPTSMDEIAAISPEMKRVVGDVMMNQPQVYNAVESRLLMANSRAEDKDLREYGKGFFDLFHRIHAPSGSPDAINNIADLYSHVGPGGDLTMAGLDKLVQQMKKSDSPSGYAEKQLQSALLEKAKNELVLYKEDSAGMDKFSAFQIWFFDAFDKARGEGKSATDLLNPDSPLYMGKAIAAFNLPLEERLKNKLNDPMQYQPPPRTLNDVIADVKSGKLSEKEGRAEYELLANEIRKKKKNAISE